MSQEPKPPEATAKGHSPAELAAQLLGAIRAQRQLALLLDYDGTLADIVANPKTATLDAPTRNALQLLSRHPQIWVALISGRSEESLREVSGIPLDSSIDLATNGGLRISSGDKSWTHPKALECVPKLQALALRIQAQLEEHPGAWLENKHLSLALHYRHASAESETTLRRQLREMLQEEGEGSDRERQGEKFHLVEGKAIFEIQPSIRWDKGMAAQTLLERWGFGEAEALDRKEPALSDPKAPSPHPPSLGIQDHSAQWLIFFAGDDLIDLPAFHFASKHRGIACLVQDRNTKVPSDAVNATLRSPADCREMIGEMGGALSLMGRHGR